MVYESPAAGRPMVCRKHSPWTMERDRKKSKAHLGSPEPLSEEVEEEAEEDEPDDHEMTEQEAHVLACLGQLNVGSFLINQADPDGAQLARAGSVPDGQRRKLRGSRALSASYHNRLRSCVLNEKGSHLPHSSKSCTNIAGGGQENTAPTMFAPVLFADHSKCWIGRRNSPATATKDTSEEPASHPSQGVTGVAHPHHFAVHGPTHSTAAADQSLLAAAALASSSRSDKHLPCESPAPKGRLHRRSLSGASVAAACGLNDSAEALHGPSEACAAGQGQPQLPGAWPSSRSASESSAQRPKPAFRQGGTTWAGDKDVDRGEPPSQAWWVLQPQPSTGDGSAHDHRTYDLPTHVRYPSSSSAINVASSALPSGPEGSAICVAKYGIAAFGVPASVQSCFTDTSLSIEVPLTTGGVAAGEASVPQLDLHRCAMSCPGDVCKPATTAGALAPHSHRHAHANGGSNGAAVGAIVAGATTVDLGSSALLELSSVPPAADASSEPLVGGHMRHGGASLASATASGKALADSAEELELRRLTGAHHQHQQSYAASIWQPSLQECPMRQQHQGRKTEDVQPQPLLPGTAGPHSRPVSMGSATAAAPGAFAAAVSEPLPGAVSQQPVFAPFDLLNLARSAGSVFGITNFSSFSTSGHFVPEAVQGAVGGAALMPPLSLQPTTQGTDSRCAGGGLANCSNISNASATVVGNGDGSAAWQTSVFANSNTFVNTRAPPAADDLVALQQSGAAAIHRLQDGEAAELLKQPASVRGTDDGAGDVRADQDDNGIDGDGEEGEEPWLRTSQQAPDPDDPSSAGKYSAVLLRRLQAAAEHEELYGVPASGGHSGAYSFFHMQGSGSSDYGLRSSSGRLNMCSQGASSSMEPSPMPRLSSRLRRLRASPCLGSGGSGGPLTSPAPSHLLGTRSRSAGVTPGGITCRRLRRRSDLLVPDQLGQGGVSARGHADVDELDNLDDSGVGADEYMHDAGHHQLLLSAGGSGDIGMRRLMGRVGDPAAHRNLSGGVGGVLPLEVRRGGSGGLHFASSPELRTASIHRGLSQSGGADVVSRAHSQFLQQQQRPQPHRADEFLSGLMDYEDDGVEYTTPPHTPLRGFGGAHDQDGITAPRAARSSLVCSDGGQNRGTSAADDGLVAIAPGRVRPGLGKGIPQQRVTFASHRPSGGDTLAASPLAVAGGSGEDASCAKMLMSNSLSTTQEFNKCLAAAASCNDRGRAERLWQEMCSRSVPPDVNTLNTLLRCLSRSAADPDDAQLLVREVCSRGGFDANGTSQRLLEEICFRFEQLNGSSLND